jgi:hypothetical protein
MQNHAQDTEAHQANDRDFGVAVDLYVPKQWNRPISAVNVFVFRKNRWVLGPYRKAVTQSVRMLTAVHA